jgi:hypothetical protein
MALCNNAFWHCSGLPKRAHNLFIYFLTGMKTKKDSENYGREYQRVTQNRKLLLTRSPNKIQVKLESELNKSIKRIYRSVGI